MKQPKPATCVRVKRSQLLNEVVGSAVSLRFKRWWQIRYARRWTQYQAFAYTSMLMKKFKCVNLIWSSAPRTASVKSVLCPFGETPLFFPARCCLKVWSVSVSFPFFHGRNRSLSHASVTRHCVENIFLLLDEMICQMNHLIFFLRGYFPLMEVFCCTW